MSAGVRTPKYQWGGVAREAVGRVARFERGDLLVDFPERDALWRAAAAEMEQTDARAYARHARAGGAAASGGAAAKGAIYTAEVSSGEDNTIRSAVGADAARDV